MGYQVTARKWRPQTFDDVVEQSHVTRTLKNAIRLGRLAHAYLFAGTRGVGKTTMARVLAKALNCEQGPTEEPCNTCASCLEITQGTSLDIVEIDGASNRGIDEIRDLRERLRYLPSRGRYKVYILDEVHMLTKEAFNALLKTLEEPPSHVVFVFATTEIERIPYTIVSRCQRFEFKRVSLKGLIAQLEHITRSEGIRITRTCLQRIAKAAEGSMRDAQSLLDQVVAYCGLEVRDEDVDQILGYVGIDLLAQCLRALLQQDAATALHLLGELQSEGHEAAGIVRALLEGLRHLIVLKTVPQPAELIPLSEADLDTLQEIAAPVSLEEIYGQFHVLSAAEQSLRHASNPFLSLEMALVRMACIGRVQSLQHILEHLQRLEGEAPPETAGTAFAPGAPVVPVAPAMPPPARPRNGHVESERPLERSTVQMYETPQAVTPGTETLVAEAPEAVRLSTPGGVWVALQQRVAERRPSLESVMQPGQPISMDDQRLVVRFAKQDKFSLDRLLEPDNLAIVREAVQGLLGRPFHIALESAENGQAGAAGVGGAHAMTAQQASALEERQRQKNELKQTVIDLFGATPI
ncbi:MAG: DNA polymerase III subunit gamma/tau [Candidatus Tectimicrobiota bacterium]